MDCGPSRSVSTSYLGKNHHLVGLELPSPFAKSLNFTDSKRGEILEERKRSDRNEKGMNSDWMETKRASSVEWRSKRKRRR